MKGKVEIWLSKVGFDISRRGEMNTWLLAILVGIVTAVAMSGGNLSGGIGLLVILPAIFYAVRLVSSPVLLVFTVLVLSFFTNGLVRYVNAPFGLLVDIVLILGWLTALFHWRDLQWNRLSNPVFIWTCVWYGFVVLELINPESIGPEAWFYAMRAMGFYQLLFIGFILLHLEERKWYATSLHVVFGLSLLATFWGLKQMIIGVDAAEHKWLYEDGNSMTHVLHGVLRVFSFYSDAGQFGAAQAMVFTMSGVLVLGPFSWAQKAFFGTVAVFSLIGFGISGTRGALAVPVAGFLMWLILSRNIRLLAAGMTVGGIVFYLLKFTFIMQGVEQVRRMRTALDPNDPSLLVRFNNQRIFASYLENKPFGAGIGSVGFWGNRFAPRSFLAKMPSDSYFVKVWVETGVVGVALHLFVLGFFLGMGAKIIWNLRNMQLKYYCIAYYSGLAGILLASYGNQVFSQSPSSFICYLGLALIFSAPRFDDKV